MKYYLAIDLGASSGRHIIGYKDEAGNLITDEVHRFKNGVEEYDGHLIWNVDSLFNEIKTGIKKALKKYPKIESLSIDTWGVDYVLFNGKEEIRPVYAYRDYRTTEGMNMVHEIISKENLYSVDGTQINSFNTIYQLYWDKVNGRLDNADSFLMLPEYFMYKLTGVKMNEYTNASTTGLLDARTNTYSEYLLDLLGIKKTIFSSLVKPGTTVGYFKDDIIEEVGGNIKVVMCATHDTASAVEGIPMEQGERSPYVSSGTWSLLGVKIDHTIATMEAYNANYSNEYGPDYIRFQKNIMGMWIVNNVCDEIGVGVVDFVKMAEKSSFVEIFDVNDDAFFAPSSMKNAIINYLKSHNQRIPNNDNDLANVVFHSLAYSYKVALDDLEKITQHSFNRLYIVGGGAKNKYLNSLIEEYIGKVVIALPIEATAIGNFKIQMEVDK